MRMHYAPRLHAHTGAKARTPASMHAKNATWNAHENTATIATTPKKWPSPGDVEGCGLALGLAYPLVLVLEQL